MTVALLVIEAIVILVLAILVAGLLRSHAEILRSLHDLGVGEDGERVAGPARQTPNVIPGVPEPRQSSTPAFDIAGVKTDGAARRIAVVETDHTTLLAFLSTGCTTCASFWKAFGETDNLDLPGVDTRLVVVTKSPGEESESRLRDLAPRQFPLVMSSEAWNDYHVPVSPYFILVDGRAGRVLGEGAAATWGQVKHLLAQAVADQSIVTRTPVPGVSSGADREDRIDRELRDAGIEPGHASLYPAATPDVERAE